MKLKISLLTLITSFTVMASAPKMCPSGTREVLSCVSQSEHSMIVMSVGAGRSPDVMKGDRVDSESTIIYTATEEAYC